MKRLLASAADRALRYLKSLETRGVAPTPEAIARLRELDTPLPDDPTDPETVLNILDEIVSPATVGISGPRFFGFVAGGSLPATLAANWLAGAWDQNSVLYNVTTGTAHVEQVALRWLLDVLRLPETCAGAFVTGATVANFAALAAARHVVLKQEGWNVEAEGLFGAPPISVVVGDEVHPSVLKSLGMLGMGRNRVTRVPVDNQGRMRPDKFPRLSSPSIVCLQAGNVNTGSFDPAAEIIPLAKASGAWVHVDGAFGIWASVTPKRAHLTAGFEQADSWATDAHKYLNVPFDSGLAFVRDNEALCAAMAVTAEYLPSETDQRNPADYTPELSRRARGVEVWAALKSLGRKGLADLVERTCKLAEQFAKGLRDAGFEILNDVVLNQVLVSFGDAETTNRIIAEIQRDGTSWCGGTVWQNHPAMRISVSSWATTEHDVDRSLDAMIRIARKYVK
jgi:glutamate/tyrosine decarboxylase-like PLP-dependent enzyme